MGYESEIEINFILCWIFDTQSETELYTWCTGVRNCSVVQVQVRWGSALNAETN